MTMNRPVSFQRQRIPEAVTAEVALVDQPVLRAVEDSAPVLQLGHPFGGLLGVQLGHAPVVEELGAPDRVTEVHSPVVALVHVLQCGGHAALGHNGVGLAEQGLADDGGVQAVPRRLDGRPKTRAPGANDDAVVLDGLNFRCGNHGVFLSP
jgi:hypothetical protein